MNNLFLYLLRIINTVSHESYDAYRNQTDGNEGYSGTGTIKFK
jgi:hypothetical protein